MRPNTVLKISTASFLLGVLTASFFPIKTTELLILTGLVVLFAFIRVFKIKSSDKVLLTLVFLVFGIVSFIASIEPNEYEKFNDRKVSFKAVVLSVQSLSQRSQVLVLKPNNYSQNLQLITAEASGVGYGDVVEVTGKLKSLGNTSEELNLKSKNIYAKVSPTSLVIVQRFQKSKLQVNLNRFRSHSSDRLGKLLKNPDHSGFILGLLFGGSGELSSQSKEAFKTLGLTHILAVSGYNFSLVMLFIHTLLKRSTRIFRLLLVCLFSLLFTLLVGPSASVLRALVMSCVASTSLLLGRKYQPAISLLIAASALVFFEPLILRFDLSFQLSFLATASVIYLTPALENFFQSAVGSKFSKFLENPISLLSAGISASFGILPISLAHFQTINFASPLVGVVILPLIPFLMLMGVLLLVPALGEVLAPFVQNILNALFGVLNEIAAYMVASININLTRGELYFISTLVLLILFVLANKQSKKEWRLTGSSKNVTLLTGVFDPISKK